MTHVEFTGVTFNDLDPSGTRISMLSEFSVVDSTEIAVIIPHKTHTLWIGIETTDKRIVYARNTRSDSRNKIHRALAIRKPTSIRYVTDMRYLEEYSGSTGVS